MKEENEHINQLIAKYLAGEALPEEAMLLDDWRAKSAENDAYFLTCITVMNSPLHNRIDIDSLLKRVKERSTDVSPQRSVIRTLFTPVRVAASLVIFALAGMTFYLLTNQQHSSTEKTYASGNTRITRRLADGSSVTLNKKTVLTLVNDFNAGERKVQLKGEAYFEVVHDVNKPFTIDAGGIEITDIGTAFNIEAYPSSDTVIIQVTEGIVDLKTSIERQRLTARQTARFIRSENKLQTVTYDENRSAYQTKKFRFNAQALGAVLAVLNEVYEQHFELENSELGRCVITVDFNNESPETIALVISETLGISYHKNGSTYVFSGNTCTQ